MKNKNWYWEPNCTLHVRGYNGQLVDLSIPFDEKKEDWCVRFQQTTNFMLTYYNNDLLLFKRDKYIMVVNQHDLSVVLRSEDDLNAVIPITNPTVVDGLKKLGIKEFVC